MMLNDNLKHVIGSDINIVYFTSLPLCKKSPLHEAWVVSQWYYNIGIVCYLFDNAIK